MTWILILMVVTSAHGVFLQSIPGFKTEKSCLSAAKQWEKNRGAYTSTHSYTSTHYGVCLMKEE